jgi:hypothetical protein
MKKMFVLYREPGMLPADPPLAFECMSEDGDHAQEQCLNAYPDCDVLWIAATDTIEAAFDDYWN